MAAGWLSSVDRVHVVSCGGCQAKMDGGWLSIPSVGYIQTHRGRMMAVMGKTAAAEEGIDLLIAWSDAVARSRRRDP